MKYCDMKFLDDGSHICSINAYRGVHGNYITIVANTLKYGTYGGDIGIYGGRVFKDNSLKAFKERLLDIKEHGYAIPDRVFESIDEDILRNEKLGISSDYEDVNHFLISLVEKYMAQGEKMRDENWAKCLEALRGKEGV